jgi:hypothetical protein
MELIRILKMVAFLCLIGIGGASSVMAAKLKLDPVVIPDLDSVKAEISTMDTDELKKVSKHYRSLISTMISYLDLTTGRKPSAPYLTIELSNEDRIHNIHGMIRKGNEIKDNVNTAIANAQREMSPIKVLFSDILLKDGEDICTADPVIETIHLGELHRFKVNCDADGKQGKELSTSFTIGYASNYTLRADGQKIISVDIMTDKSRSALAQIENSNNLILTLKTTYKPF